jgi:ribose transport system ATP-binding protein
MIGEELVRIEGISKEFPGVKALSNVDFVVRKGEVHALVGENGAGKSTLIKILMGVYPKDKGKIFIEGEEVEIKSPIQAKKYGFGAVYQDVILASHLSIGENFFLGKLPMKGLVVDWKTVRKVSQEALKKLGLDIDQRKKIKDLTMAQQEMVAVAKIVYENSKVIVFDEPTAFLTNKEIEQLFTIIKKLKSQDIGVIYISHRIEEIFAICDTVTVLKDGHRVGTLPVSDINYDGLVSMMIGRDLKDVYNIESHKSQEVVLEVKNLTRKPKFRNINFKLHEGEILCIFGLVGSRGSDIARCIFGADKYDAGEIFINNKRKDVNSPIDAISLGIGFLPEDRKLQGLALKSSVVVNINLVIYNQISTLGIINRGEERKRAVKYVDELRIKISSLHQKVERLSGGNQQKVIISKWLNAQSDILIFDEPTSGVDIGAKLEIYRFFEKIISGGQSIIVISSYLPEVMGLADRIVIMHEGKCAGIVNNNERVSGDDILKLASGLRLVNNNYNQEVS